MVNTSLHISEKVSPACLEKHLKAERLFAILTVSVKE